MASESSEESADPFYVKDCALAAIAIGSKAQTLREFRDCLKNINADSIYYHFWRQSMEATLAPGSFYNDFSNWAHYQLHDDTLAECLALLDPSEYPDMEKLRGDMLEIIENRLDELNIIALDLHASPPFHFMRSKIVIFNTPYKMDHPRELVKTIPMISKSSVFYHFIDARRRTEAPVDDFSTWLMSYRGEFQPLVEQLKQIDPYFISLADLQKKLTLAVTKYFLDACNSAPREEKA